MKFFQIMIATYFPINLQLAFGIKMNLLEFNTVKFYSVRKFRQRKKIGLNQISIVPTAKSFLIILPMPTFEPDYKNHVLFN